jgi:hypothetical protein
MARLLDLVRTLDEMILLDDVQFTTRGGGSLDSASLTQRRNCLTMCPYGVGGARLHAFFKDCLYEFLALMFIVAFWQLTRGEMPAEGAVYVHDVLGTAAHRIAKASPAVCVI